MKRIITTTMACFLLMTSVNNAQVVSETVSVNPGYTHQVHYSMQYGAFPAVDNTNWDLGFQIRGLAASIIINSKNNVQLFRAMKPAADWMTMTVADTTGLLNSLYELHNSDESWDAGAFNSTNDTANQFDLGWGIYDFATHVISGDSIYFIKLSNGIYKKLVIESLNAGTYNFRWADLDGSNETIGALSKSNFQNKFFGYFSLLNNTSIDREPVYNTWDLLFTQYLTLTPYIYKVTGVLFNDSVEVEKAYPVDVNTTQYNPTNYSQAINTIGYDWKTYDFNSNSYIMADSLVYFVRNRTATGVWKVIFTGFDGAATGNFYFDKELVTTGITEGSAVQVLSAYPNPASDFVSVTLNNNQSAAESTYSIVNVLGEIVLQNSIKFSEGLSTIPIPVSDLKDGIYLFQIAGGKNASVKIIVQHK